MNVLKWILKISKYLILLVVSLLAVSVLASSLILFTHTGNQTALALVKKFESRLTIELVKGSLFDVPHFENIRWQDGETVVDIQKLDYQFDWSCLVDKLCLTQFNVNGLQVSIPETNSAEQQDIDKTNSQSTVIDIPIAVLIEAINITDVTFKMGQLKVDLDAFTLQADAFQQDVNLSSQIAGLLVTLPDSEPEVATKPTNNKAKKQMDLRVQSLPALLNSKMLPVIALPVNLTVKPIDIKTVKVVQNNTTLFALDSLHSAFTFENTKLTINQFDLAIPETIVSLNGNVDFIDDYPLDIDINGTIKRIKQLQPETLLEDVHYKLSSKGSLSDLSTTLDLSNKLALQLSSHVNLFADNLPHQLTLNWQSLQWPLTGESQYRSKKGQFTSKGSLLNNKISLHSDYFVTGAPEGKVSLNTSGDLQHLNIEQLTVETLDGNINFSGILAWKDKIDWLGQLDINNINIAALQTEYDGVFSGQIKQQVAVTLYENAEPEWQFDFPELAIAGQLLSRSIKLSGRVSGDNKQGILFEKLGIDNEQNNLVVDGRLAKQNDLSIALNLADVSHLVIGSNGEVYGDVHLTGPNDALKIMTNLSANSLSFQQYMIKKAELGGALILTDKPQVELKLDAEEIDAAGQYIDDVKLQIKNEAYKDNFYRHQIKLLANSELISTDLNIYLTQTVQKLLIQLDSAKVLLPHQSLNLLNPIKIISRENSVDITAHCWKVIAEQQADAGNLCINNASIGESGQVNIDIDRYLLSNLTPFLPQQINMKGAVSAAADMKWKKGDKPIFGIKLFSDDVVLSINSDESTKAFKDYAMQDFNVDVQGLREKISVNANLFSESLIDIKVDAKVLPYKDEPTIEADVIANMPDFSSFLTLMPSLEDLAGELESEFNISGNLKKPTVNGSIALNNGQVSSVDLPMKISEITALVEVKESKALLQGSFNSNDTNTLGEKVAAVPLLTNTLNLFDQSVKKVGNTILDNNAGTKELKQVAKASPGIAYMNGVFDWSKELTGDVHFFAHKLQVYDYGKIDLLISPDIHLTINEHLKVIGDLFIDKGKIVVKELPPGAISQSSDIVVVDAETGKVAPNLPVIINLGVDMGSDFQIIAMGLDTFINGKLLIEKPLDKDLSINGGLQLSDGSYRALGQQLTLQESRIIFQGAPDSPYLQIEAIRDPSKIEDDVTAGVRVTGPVDALELIIFSEPAMAQQEALSYLTRGQGLNSSSDSSTMANMLIDIAAGQSDGLMSTIGEEIGIKDLSLSSSGTGDEQSVGIRGEIAPGVEISYGVGVFDTFSILSLRYEILERLYIEASSGIYQAVDAYYEWDWD